MTTAALATTQSPVTAWRHARAVALLPLMNTLVIPSLLLARWRSSMPSFATLGEMTIASAGAVLALCGAALVAHSIALFVRIGRGTLAPWDPTQELVAVGAYRYSRNPMKAGLFLILAGETLLTRSAAIALWFTVFAVVNVVYIRLHEEPALLLRFGNRYRDYCTRVPRWWPALRSLRTTLD
jgi:protein-S-isoprenylcysteine O-methyltransferase Ste14